jgi:NADPH-dependent 2,4-dienoyl-CoA reductase/sulfur reductase-like enzyme
MNLHLVIAWSVAAFSFKTLAKPESVYEARHLARSEQIEASYDYVIVGGGTAGLTVADRLTEDGKCLQS